MKEQARTWSAFAACSVLLLGAMGYVSVRAVSLEAAEARARAETRRQETMRLALWRMDSWMTALIAREAARPWFHYHSFYSAERPYSTIPGDINLDNLRADEPLAASPLLLERPEGVRLYFQVANNQLSSPQTVDGGLQGMALLADAKPPEMERARADLSLIRSTIAGTAFGKSLGLADPVPFNGQAWDASRGSQGKELTQFLDLAPKVPGKPAPQATSPVQTTSQQELQKQNDYSVRQQMAESVQNRQTTNLSNTNIALRRSGQDDRSGADLDAAKRSVESGVSKTESLTTQAQSPVDGKADIGEPAPELSAIEKKLAADALDKLRAKEGNKVPARDEVNEDSKNKVKDSTGASETDKELRKSATPWNTDVPKPQTTGFLTSNPVVTSPARADPSPLAVACTPAAAFPDLITLSNPTVAPKSPPIAGPELFLTRHIATDSGDIHQAIWLDWSALRGSLLATIKDLSSDATLELVPQQQSPALEPADASSRMASIPAKLAFGPSSDAAILASVSLPSWSPTKTGLVIGWAAILAALCAIGLVLRASILLSQRRGRFVSAVTHELRTPLTTFTLYSQMLADGMITEESARHEYYKTLRNEAQRLSRIVESVLDYAHLGTRSGGVKVTPIPAQELVDRVVPLLKTRASDGGMELVIEAGNLQDITVNADHNSVERILLNLIDNANKYAQSASDRRVHLTVEADTRALSLTLADHGPGISPDERDRIFSPFQRGKAQSSGNTPGMGLGLAFARTLAQDLGGDLKLVKKENFGAAFELRLKITP